MVQDECPDRQVEGRFSKIEGSVGCHSRHSEGDAATGIFGRKNEQGELQEYHEECSQQRDERPPPFSSCPNQ